MCRQFYKLGKIFFKTLIRYGKKSLTALYRFVHNGIKVHNFITEVSELLDQLYKQRLSMTTVRSILSFIFYYTINYGFLICVLSMQVTMHLKIHHPHCYRHHHHLHATASLSKQSHLLQEADLCQGMKCTFLLQVVVNGKQSFNLIKEA